MRLREIIDSPCGLRYMLETLPLSSGYALNYMLESELLSEKEDPWRIFRIMAEFVDTFDTMADLGPLVPIFGSARIGEDHPYYKSACDLAGLLVKNG